MAELIPRDVLEDPEACANFFNNWHSNLPGGSRRIYHQDMLDDPNPDPEYRRGLTHRQFHAAIDQALIRFGIAPQDVAPQVVRQNQLVNEELAFIREHLKAPEGNEADVLLLQLINLTVPAFVFLMEQGFTHSDLTA